MPGEIVLERMPLPAGQIHVLGTAGRIEAGKLQAQSIRVLRLNACLRAFTKEAFEPLVPERRESCICGGCDDMIFAVSTG